MQNKKNIIIAALGFVIVMLLIVGKNIKSEYDMKLYAVKNNCTWSYQGTMYGDDRDFICRDS